MLVFDYKCLDDKCEVIDERFVKDIDDFQFCAECGCEMIRRVSSPAMVKGNEYDDKCGYVKPK